MQGSGFKAVIIFLLLSILAFIAGSLAADSASSALLPALMVIGVFLLLYLGKNAWSLVFIVPSVLTVLNYDILSKMPVGNMAAGVVLFYILLMAMMGHQRLRWNGIFYFDIIFLIFYVYFLYGWVRNPVTIRQFTSLTDYGYDQQLGGAYYIYAIASIFPFLVVSIIDQKLEKVLFVLKLAFWFTFTLSLISMFRNYGELVSAGKAEAAFGESRVNVFAISGRNIITLLLCKSTFFGIMISVWKLPVVLLAALGILWSGTRMNILLLFCILLWVSYFAKQLLWIFLCVLFSWGAIVYLSYQVDFSNLPKTVYRASTVIPGVKYDEHLVGNAFHSLEWRMDMWSLAFDPSSGYIEDYTWGDGFAYSSYRERIRVTADSFGLINLRSDYHYYADNGGWHNGCIEIVHRTGFVGLALAIWLCGAGLCVAYKVWRYMPKIKNREYGLYYVVLMVGHVVFLFLERGFTELFNGAMFSASIAKMLYGSLKREGYMVNTSGRKYYVPLIMREDEAVQEPAEEKPRLQIL